MLPDLQSGGLITSKIITHRELLDPTSLISAGWTKDRKAVFIRPSTKETNDPTFLSLSSIMENEKIHHNVV